MVNQAINGKKMEKEAFKQVNLQHSPKALTRLLLQVDIIVNVNKFRLEYYPHLFPDSLEHTDKRKLMKRFLFCRYTVALFHLLKYRMFWATKILPRATRL